MGFQELVRWALDNGSTLHPSIEVYDDPITGLSFRVKPDAKINECPGHHTHHRIVSIPTRLSLSYLNALDLPHEFLAATRPHVVGRFFLIQQYFAGKDSFWWPYIQSLPQPTDREAWELPPFWPADDVELLDGTNVEVGLKKIQNEVSSEFKAARQLLSRLDHELAGKVRLEHYQWAYSIFSSRSFRPSLVLSDPSLPSGIALDDFSVLLPLFDIGNHDMRAPVKWELHQQACSLFVEKSHVPGEQVFNNYSLKTNAELLLGYGFMIPSTDSLHNDYIHVRKRASEASLNAEEYYVSLRPLGDPSSLLGFSRERAPSSDVLPSFRHVPGDMVLDIFHTVTESSGRGPIATQNILTGQVDPENRIHLQQTIAVIQHKLLQELERLEETDVEVDEDQREALTRNQQLALWYRESCRQVLEAALESIASDVFMQIE